MSNLTSQLLESTQPDHLIVILDESARWYNKGPPIETSASYNRPWFSKSFGRMPFKTL